MSMHLQSANGDLLAGTAAQSDKRAVYGNTGTHHGCGIDSGDVLRNGEDEVLVCSDVRSHTTL